eukprot:1989182-Pyramimonas_sp.AAC.1
MDSGLVEMTPMQLHRARVELLRDIAKGEYVALMSDTLKERSRSQYERERRQREEEEERERLQREAAIDRAAETKRSQPKNQSQPKNLSQPKKPISLASLEQFDRNKSTGKQMEERRQQRKKVRVKGVRRGSEGGQKGVRRGSGGGANYKMNKICFTGSNWKIVSTYESLNSAH